MGYERNEKLFRKSQYAVIESPGWHVVAMPSGLGEARVSRYRFSPFVGRFLHSSSGFSIGYGNLSLRQQVHRIRAAGGT